MSGETHIGLLKKHGCKFWDPWADETGQGAQRLRELLASLSPVHDPEGRAAFNDQVAWVLDELKRNPMSRRLVVTAWAPGNAQTSKLPPCHLLFAFNVQMDPSG